MTPVKFLLRRNCRRGSWRTLHAASVIYTAKWPIVLPDTDNHWIANIRLDIQPNRIFVTSLNWNFQKCCMKYFKNFIKYMKLSKVKVSRPISSCNVFANDRCIISDHHPVRLDLQTVRLGLLTERPSIRTWPTDGEACWGHDCFLRTCRCDGVTHC